MWGGRGGGYHNDDTDGSCTAVWQQSLEEVSGLPCEAALVPLLEVQVERLQHSQGLTSIVPSIARAIPFPAALTVWQ